MAIRPDSGSFRDPRGRVHVGDGRVLRTITRSGIDDFRAVQATGLLDRLVDRKELVDFEEIELSESGFESPDTVALLEHPPLPFVSYPYEWGFELLKAAALLHLDVQLEALELGSTLTDATAYNIQFVGTNPVFIDHLAFRPYREGEFWAGHRQFCEQFLNPLLLRAKVGIPHNAWYRGALEGISTTDLNKTLPFRRKWSWNVFSQVVLQAHFQKASMDPGARKAVSLARGLPQAAFHRMLTGLRRWIESLSPLGTERTIWGDYAENNSYTGSAAAQKREFVAAWAAESRPKLAWDIGCNTGEYCAAALDAGAEYVVGFDFDQVAIDRAVGRARAGSLPFLPLYLDATNPAPNQGWSQRERKGLSERAPCDGILALALVHHLCIAKNIPMEGAVDWIMSLAPTGVVEFVPKSDPMVQELLRLREDIFDDYDFDRFVQLVSDRGEIVRSERVLDSDRRLIRYRRP